MRLRLFCVLAVLLCVTSAAAAAVRIGIKGGKRVIYNDGVGPSSREALGKSDSWLAARIATPSLYDGLIADAARRNSLDPRLVKSVVLIESAFNPAAVSRKGAQGLMQLMPETAVRYGVRDTFDPTENLSGGARHLAYLLELYGGDLPRALAAYNAGEEAVARYGGVPPFDETRVYVSKGLAAYYGKSSLGGGFGLSAGQTWGGLRGRPVRMTRDPRTNRPLITNDFSPPRGLKKG
ncbi:MAG TPA: lytic transglycosylase domain-containing protein [Thermoanaerobaculia bacterium]|nr:lytic transglycosylase domain-containing protein [Thermoanaerobaculia bacterium]